MLVLALIALIMTLLCVFGMVKWYSTLFSDGRGKLGNQVVFSNWKGRPYMRAYALPANPNTLKQQAQRACHTKGVASYQTNVGGDATKKGLWNELALTRQISGFNLFMKYVDEIDISCDAGGAAPYDNTVTYTIPTDVSIMGMYRSKDGAQPTELKAPGTLETGVGKTVADNALAAGVYRYFIAPGSLFADSPPPDASLVYCAHYEPDEAAGTAPEAVCTAT